MEEEIKMNKSLEYSNFEVYPHYVYATAFLVERRISRF